MQPTTTSSSSLTTTTTNSSTPALPKARFNWIFSAEKFTSTPSNRDGISPEEELALRQQAAVFIYELGTNLKVPHYCINTAVVYMHRFYMIDSFKRFTRQRVCAASLFLACKVEEFPRTLRDVIENTGKVLKRKKAEELTKEMIEQYADDIVLHENILLSTLGFSLMVDHPHPIIIKTIQTLGSQIQSLPEKTPRELAQTAYYLATKSILLTSFCVKYPPDLIACFCIHLAAAWLKIEIPSPASTATPVNGSDNTVTEGTPNKRWFHLVNESFTEKQLGELADEFLAIYEKCPDKIKRKLVYQNERQPQSSSNDGASSSQHHSSTTNAPSRPTDLADSVVPQGAIREKIEPRPNQPPLPPNRPAQPPPSSQSSSSSSSGVMKREPGVPTPTFSSSNRPPMPSHNPSSSSRSSSYQHPSSSLSSSQYQNHHHVNNNYNQHSRYPPQQPRPGPPPPNRSSQPPLPPPQHGVDRKPPLPPHPYDHPPLPSAPSNRPPYGSQQRTHHNNVPPSSNPYPPQAPYGHSLPPSLMQVGGGGGGEKRGYDSAYDPANHNKRPRPSSSSSQQWNNK
jgi:cyclin T